MHCRLACRLQAGNAEGNGEFSSEAACSTAKPPPPAPTSVIAYVAAEHAGGVLCFECHSHVGVFWDVCCRAIRWCIPTHHSTG